MTTKRYGLLATFGALMAAAVIGTPIAHATPMNSAEQTFVKDIDGIGISSTSGTDDIVATGYKVCKYRAEGYSVDYVADEMYQGSNHRLTVTLAAEFVNLAEVDLCPSQMGMSNI